MPVNNVARLYYIPRASSVFSRLFFHNLPLLWKSDVGVLSLFTAAILRDGARPPGVDERESAEGVEYINSVAFVFCTWASERSLFIKRQMLHLDLSLSHKSLIHRGSSQSWPPRRILILSAIIQTHTAICMFCACVGGIYIQKPHPIMRPETLRRKIIHATTSCSWNSPKIHSLSLGPSVKISSLSLARFFSQRRKGWVSENLIITLRAPLHHRERESCRRVIHLTNISCLNLIKTRFYPSLSLFFRLGPLRVEIFASVA